MDADIHLIHQSDFYQIKDFICRCKECTTSKPEYNETFCISFVRTGNFLFNVFRNALDSYSGCILVTKPGFERTVTHMHAIPDQCTIIEFTSTVYQELLDRQPHLRFFHDNDKHATLFRVHPETEYLHFKIWSLINTGNFDKIEMDSLIIDLAETVLKALEDDSPNFKLDNRTKKNHLPTVELAKHYISQNYARNISLSEVANHCCLSLFHFCRVFKELTSWSPHQFLLMLRLKNATLLLRTSTLPVIDIAFSSGFNSVEHFTSTFRRKFKISPTEYRKMASPRLIGV